jgi:hypothetical protein
MMKVLRDSLSRGSTAAVPSRIAAEAGTRRQLLAPWPSGPRPKITRHIGVPSAELGGNAELDQGEHVAMIDPRIGIVKEPRSRVSLATG